MQFEEKKDKLLNQLNKASGIRFEISESDLSDEDTINKLRELLLHFNTMENKSAFYKEYFTGELSASEAALRLNRFHIKDIENRFLFYLESKHEYSADAVSLLKSLRQNAKDEIIEMDPHHIVLISHLSDEFNLDDIDMYANQILDMLESEAYSNFKLSYHEPAATFSQLLTSYNSIVMAMQIGNTFFNENRIYNFAELGMGRLLYNVPISECEAFLSKNISVDILSSIDEETLSTLDSFFENDLSIAETARQLFVHRNTLIYRLDKFAELTGLDVRKFNDAITCKISLMLFDYIKSIH